MPLYGVFALLDSSMLTKELKFQSGVYISDEVKYCRS